MHPVENKANKFNFSTGLIGKTSSLAAYRRQAIIWNIDNQFHWHVYMCIYKCTPQGLQEWKLFEDR